MDAPRWIALRGQMAIVRALVDEVDRLSARDADGALRAQLVEEIGRLGARILDVAAAMTRAREPEEVPATSGVRLAIDAR